MAAPRSPRTPLSRKPHPAGTDTAPPLAPAPAPPPPGCCCDGVPLCVEASGQVPTLDRVSSEKPNVTCETAPSTPQHTLMADSCL